MISVGRLTTHVLDTACGVPAAGVDIRLYALGGDRRLVASAVTNSDGRTDCPMLEDDAMVTGECELEFDIGTYFSKHGVDPEKPAFLNTIVIRFTIRADEHYHVPLLVTPWSYSTYRGS